MMTKTQTDNVDVLGKVGDSVESSSESIDRGTHHEEENIGVGDEGTVESDERKDTNDDEDIPCKLRKGEEDESGDRGTHQRYAGITTSSRSISCQVEVSDSELFSYIEENFPSLIYVFNVKTEETRSGR